jgi:hypothetical protein
MSLSVSSVRRQNAGLLLLLYASLIFALFPGRFDADSVLQYYQGIIFNFFDLLSPLMALLLGILHGIARGPGPMFVIQFTLYSIGVLLLSDSMIVAGYIHSGQATTLLMLAPIVSFNFLSVQKDALFCALIVLAMGTFARSIVAPKQITIVRAIFWLGVLALLWDLRKNSLFMLLPICFGVAYFIFRIQSHVAKTWAVAGLLFVGSYMLQELLVYKVLPTGHSYALTSVILFDLAGISHRLDKDVSSGVVGTDFVADAHKCYTEHSVDNLMPWGLCKSRGLLLQQEFETRQGQNAAIRAWLKAVVQHPFAYAAHRWAHFATFMQVSCSGCANPMNIGVSIKRPYGIWQPDVPRDFSEPERVTVLGLMFERLAMMSYQSAWSWGFCWMIVLAAGMIVAGVTFRRGEFNQFDLLMAIASVSGFIYGAGFLIVGVSDAQWYLHVVYALGLMTVCLMLRYTSRVLPLMFQPTGPFKLPNGLRTKLGKTQSNESRDISDIVTR